MPDPSKVGQDRAYQDVVDEYDASKGKYSDACEDIPEDTKLPTGNMPMGAEPTPFSLGPTTPSAGRD